MSELFVKGNVYRIEIGILPPKINHLTFYKKDGGFFLVISDAADFKLEDGRLYFTYKGYSYHFIYSHTEKLWEFVEAIDLDFENVKKWEGKICTIFYDPLSRKVQFTFFGDFDPNPPLPNAPLTSFKRNVFSDVIEINFGGNDLIFVTKYYIFYLKVADSVLGDRYRVTYIKKRGDWKNEDNT